LTKSCDGAQTAIFLRPAFPASRVHHISDRHSKTQFTLYNRFENRFDNRLYRVNKHPTGCQTALTTGWMFVYTIQPVVKRIWQPVERTATVRSTRLSHRVVQPVWQPAVYTIQPVVKPVWQRVWQPVVSCKRGL